MLNYLGEKSRIKFYTCISVIRSETSFFSIGYFNHSQEKPRLSFNEGKKKYEAGR
jgi:hypothetical protein